MDQAQPLSGQLSLLALGNSAFCPIDPASDSAEDPPLVLLTEVESQLRSLVLCLAKFHPRREMAAILELEAVLQRFFDWGSKYFSIMRSDRAKVERPAA
jgi:hypothetical protein